MSKGKVFKIYVETYGCSMNISDSIQMEELLKKNGFEIVDNPDFADVVIINTCGVKGPTENKIIRRIKELYPKFKNRLIITGCLTLISTEKLKKLFPEASLVSPQAENRIVDVVKSVLQGNKCVILDKKPFVRVCYPSRPYGIIGIVPISEGCLGNCYFCATKFARGRLFSYPKEKILTFIQDLIRKGAKELWITSQDTGAYGLDIGENIVSLMEFILKNLKKKDIKIRIGMMNPNFARRFIDDLLEIYEDERVFKFLHVPVQSGSNKVLKSMNRTHTVEDYLYVVRKFRKRFPEGTIATDVIVGYPTETEEDFWKTVEIIEETKPDFLNLSKFWPRPRTEAIKMFKDLPSDVKKRRAKILKNIWRVLSIKRKEKYVDEDVMILIDEVIKEGFVGRMNNYLPVFTKGGKLGIYKKVKIIGFSPLNLLGA